MHRPRGPRWRGEQVPEKLGHVPEPGTPLEEFRAEVLGCLDAMLERVTGIQQVPFSGWSWGKGSWLTMDTRSESRDHTRQRSML